MTDQEAVETVNAALARSVDGDLQGGAALLVPLISHSAGSAYALAVMLAEQASFIARREGRRPGSFALAVDNVETGEEGSVDDLPTGVAFAARFVTAWSNRDHDTAEALFTGLVNTSDPEGAQLVDGLIALFQMAVATATAVVSEARAARNNLPE